MCQDRQQKRHESEAATLWSIKLTGTAVRQPPSDQQESNPCPCLCPTHLSRFHQSRWKCFQVAKSREVSSLLMPGWPLGLTPHHTASQPPTHYECPVALSTCPSHYKRITVVSAAPWPCPLPNAAHVEPGPPGGCSFEFWPSQVG